MKKITGSFLALVLLIIFSSIVYIWQAESEREALQSTIATQEKTIAQLQEEIEQKNSETGKVQGVITQTGTISGTITFTQSVPTESFIVCARDVRSQQEYCGSPVSSDIESEYSYTLDIPVGRYEVFATILQETSTSATQSADQLDQPTETYYSDFTVCNESGACISDSERKRFLEIIPDETQTDIDISI